MSEKVANLLEIPVDAPHLVEALTHPSHANERQSSVDNQRLEFLGDAVLGLCTSELLIQRFPNADEGTLTRVRARLVNAEHLAAWGRQTGLAEEILLGRGAEANGLAQSTNVIADAVEACIAAAYLDAGLDAARRICSRIVQFSLEEPEAVSALDPKSALQELGQSIGVGLPSYQVVDSGGPPHERWFEVRVGLADRWLASWRGRSKRAAERAAAEAALAARDQWLSDLARPAAQTPEICP